MSKHPKKSQANPEATYRAPRFAPAPIHCRDEAPAPPPEQVPAAAAGATAIIRLFDTWFQIPASLVPTLLAELRSQFPVNEEGLPSGDLEVIQSEVELHRLIKLERRRHDHELFRRPQDLTLPVYLRLPTRERDLVATLPDSAPEPVSQTPDMFLAQGRAFLEQERQAAILRKIEAFHRAAQQPAQAGDPDDAISPALARIPVRKLPPHLN